MEMRKTSRVGRYVANLFCFIFLCFAGRVIMEHFIGPVPTNVFVLCALIGIWAEVLSDILVDLRNT